MWLENLLALESFSRIIKKYLFLFILFFFKIDDLVKLHHAFIFLLVYFLLSALVLVACTNKNC